MGHAQADAGIVHTKDLADPGGIPSFKDVWPKLRDRIDLKSGLQPKDPVEDLQPGSGTVPDGPAAPHLAAEEIKGGRPFEAAQGGLSTRSTRPASWRLD